MKKETVSTFDGGLNMDLNPIVTPNNILTDSLNGQFITFNGDELSLQTDSGNTRIKIPGTEEYVKLSEGFHPLGMKEHNGVLYIISTDDDEIEIGSYPSPDYTGNSLFNGETISYNSSNNEFSGKLYKTFVINESNFKSGRYIKFNTVASDFNNVSNQDNDKIYLIKLYHKLDNGFLDLTDDVWERFLKHKVDTGDTASHWLLSTTFQYFCPSQFKGNLAIQTLINEDGFDFKLSKTPVVSDYERQPTDNPQVNYSHEIKFNLEWNSSNNIDLQDENKYNIKIKDFNDNTLFSSNYQSNEIRILIPFNGNEIYDGIRYEIQPLVKLKQSSTWLDATVNELPEEFINKYLISGVHLLAERYNDIFFTKEDDRCIGNGEKAYYVWVMSNRNGRIDYNLEPTDIKYVFIHENALLDETMYPLGRFRIVNNKPILITTTDLEEEQKITAAKNALNSIASGLYDSIESNFLSQEVVLKNVSECVQVEIKIKFNLTSQMLLPNAVNEDAGYKLRITQGGKYLTYNCPTMDGRTFIINTNSVYDIYVNHEFPYNTQGQYNDKNHTQHNVVGASSMPVPDTIYTSFKIPKETLINKTKYECNAAIVTGWRPLNLANNFNYSGSIVPGVSGKSYSWFYSGAYPYRNINILTYLKEQNTFNISFPDKTTHGWEIKNNSIRVAITPSYTNNDISWQNIPTYTIGGNYVNNKYINLPNNEYVELGNNDVGYIVLKKQGTIYIYSRNF